MGITIPPCDNPDYAGVAAHIFHMIVSFKAWNELVRFVAWENVAAHMGHPWFFLGILADIIGIVQNISGANRVNVYYFDLMNIVSMAYAVIGMPFFAGLYIVSVNNENLRLYRLGYATAVLIALMPLVFYRRRKRLRMYSLSKFAVLMSLLMMTIQAIRYKDGMTLIGIFLIYYAVEKVGNGNNRVGAFSNYHKMMILIALANIFFMLGFSNDYNLRVMVGESRIKVLKKHTEKFLGKIAAMLPDLRRRSEEEELFGDYEAGKGKGKGKRRGGKGKGPEAQEAPGPAGKAGKGPYPMAGKGPQMAGKGPQMQAPPAAGGKGGRPPAAKGSHPHIPYGDIPKCMGADALLDNRCQRLLKEARSSRRVTPLSPYWIQAKRRGRR